MVRYAALLLSLFLSTPTTGVGCCAVQPDSHSAADTGGATGAGHRQTPGSGEGGSFVGRRLLVWCECWEGGGVIAGAGQVSHVWAAVVNMEHLASRVSLCCVAVKHWLLIDSSSLCHAPAPSTNTPCGRHACVMCTCLCRCVARRTRQLCVCCCGCCVRCPLWRWTSQWCWVSDAGVGGVE